MIVVVGSVNLDLVARVRAHPAPGETVTAKEFVTVHGGKGANQAVAAARLGGSVTFIGAVGDDAESPELLARLTGEGVDVTHVRAVEGERSGVATITVDDLGENAIVVHPGANASVSLAPADLELISAASVVLLQLEIPVDVVTEAARAATGTVILNAAPAQVLPDSLVDSVDVLVVNEHERAITVGDDAGRIATIVTTLGSAGAEIRQGDSITTVPAPVVSVVDTTGAGDTFCGAFAEAIDRGEDVVGAVKWAARAGSLATTGFGARGAMPTRAEMVDADKDGN